MTRLANATALLKHQRIPASLLARQYESGLPADRNNMFQFYRIGDVNDSLAHYAMKVKAAWCSLMQSLAIPDDGFVCVSIESLGWNKIRIGPKPHIRPEEEVGEAVTRLRTLIHNCSPQTRQLARAAAERQRTKTIADIDTWTRQIIEDIKDADD